MFHLFSQTQPHHCLFSTRTAAQVGGALPGGPSFFHPTKATASKARAPELPIQRPQSGLVPSIWKIVCIQWNDSRRPVLLRSICPHDGWQASLVFAVRPSFHHLPCHFKCARGFLKKPHPLITIFCHLIVCLSVFFFSAHSPSQEFTLSCFWYSPT